MCCRAVTDGRWQLSALSLIYHRQIASHSSTTTKRRQRLRSVWGSRNYTNILICCQSLSRNLFYPNYNVEVKCFETSVSIHTLSFTNIRKSSEHFSFSFSLSQVVLKWQPSCQGPHINWKNRDYLNQLLGQSFSLFEGSFEFQVRPKS